MIILYDMQGSPGWVDARVGRATASNYHRIFQPTRQKLSTAWRTYSYELIAETFLGGPDPWKMEGETADMRRGKATENKARVFYQLASDIDVKQIGCMVHDNDFWLSSPDGLADDRGLELKCPAPHTQIGVLIAGKVPAKHLPQIHGGMIVSGLDRWDYLSYCTGLPAFLATVERDEYTVKLEATLTEFTDKHFKLLEKVRKDREEFILAEVDRRKNENPTNIKAFVA